MLANLTRRYGRPAWGIDRVTIKGRDVAVREAGDFGIQDIPTRAAIDAFDALASGAAGHQRRGRLPQR